MSGRPAPSLGFAWRVRNVVVVNVFDGCALFLVPVGACVAAWACAVALERKANGFVRIGGCRRCAGGALFFFGQELCASAEG